MKCASNSGYLLALKILLTLLARNMKVALFILLIIFKLFESMQVLDSNTHIDMSLCEHSTGITHIDSTGLT